MGDFVDAERGRPRLMFIALLVRDPDVEIGGEILDHVRRWSVFDAGFGEPQIRWKRQQTVYIVCHLKGLLTQVKAVV